MIDKKSEIIKFGKFLGKNQEGTIKIEFDEDNIKSEYLGSVDSKIFNFPKENRFMNFFFGHEWGTKGFWGLAKILMEGILAIIGLITIIKWIINLFLKT